MKQEKILPIADAHKEYAEKLKEQLEEHNIRVELDDRQEKIGYKLEKHNFKKYHIC